VACGRRRDPVCGIAGRNPTEEAPVQTTEAVTARREDLLQRLAHQSETLRSSEGWRRWLTFAAKFRTYSLQNQLLIQSQHPTASFVAGYRTWQSLGRQVKKGERGIAILAPMLRRVVEEDSNEQRRVLSGFKVVFVFNVDQTEGAPLPVPNELPAVRIPDLALRDQLIAVAERAGLSVRFVPQDPSGARGWYAWQERAITLVDSYPPESQIRTMLHELAHAVDPIVGTAGSVRAERELVAESTAYLIGTELGLGIEETSTQYVTGWGADTLSLTRLARQVLAATQLVDQIIAELPLPGL
jgi:antirestriction protein ArdC